ncbi:MAG: hypothetical protein HQM09_16155 [Candidatus Riflebacteria bacterium]|nr:hypothetical protein [Candidatus Riflebacteria bacterium]
MMAYFEWSAIGYFALYLGKLFLASGIVQAFFWASVGLLLGTTIAFCLLILMPRIIEDYVKIYNWYINSDFYVIFEEKIDVRLIFKIIGLPFFLVAGLFFLIVNLNVRTAYNLAAKLNLLRCVHCASTIEWTEGTVICHICGEQVTGSATKTCPGCNFKANTVRCPFCGYVTYVDLAGRLPSGRAGRKG